MSRFLWPEHNMRYIRIRSVTASSITLIVFFLVNLVLAVAVAVAVAEALAVEAVMPMASGMVWE